MTGLFLLKACIIPAMAIFEAGFRQCIHQFKEHFAN